jgi:trimeric autotransporter adhesin
MNVRGMLQGFHFSTMVALFCASAAQAWCAPAATTTTLAITSGGNPVTTVASGSMVTLTATVVAGTTAVTVGQVNFCDAAAKYCTDIHIVGTAQLIQTGAGAGTAVFRFIPGIGSHSYKAVFAGTTIYAGSMSGPANFTVTGLYPTVTTATWSGTSTGYTLTANAGGGGSTALTGKVSFIDATDGNSVLSTVDLTPGTGKLAFSNPSSPASWYGPYSVAVGDFNGDGIPDLAFAFSSTVLLGNGDGTFVPASSALPVGGVSCAAADINGDGKLDLVVVNSDIVSNSVYVTALLGNGDGTFVAAPTLTVAAGFEVSVTVAVADFNGDGIPDIALATSSSGQFLLLGKGDGTFVSSPLPNVADYSMLVGDFNKDGIPDLVMSSGALLLGKGDGTFQATTVPIPSPGASSIVVGDFNGDGNPDLIATMAGSDLFSGTTMLVLLGAGDGTFPATVTMTEPATYGNLLTVGTVGDFNGDGILDLALAGCLGDCAYSPSPITILLGDGTGHFALSSQFTEGFGADFMLSPDLNGDGLSDLVVNVVTAHNDNPYTAVRIAEKQTATATASGITLSPDAPVPHQVFASYAGDATYKPSKSGSMSVGAGTGSVTVNISSSANPVPVGGAVTLTATLTSAAPAPTGSVKFFDANTELGSAALSNTGVATISASGFTAGWHTITASYSGDSNYAPTSGTFALQVVGTATSSVTIAPSAATITDRQPLTVNITVNGVSGQPAPTGQVSLAFTSSPGNLFLTAGTVENGTASVNIPAGTLWSGPNLLTVGYTGDNVYGISSATTTIIVSLVVIAIPPPSPVTPGASITATATLQAGSTYSGTMNLACTLTSSPAGAQSLPSCTLSAASIALTPTGIGTTVVTVKTTGATRGALQRPRLFGIGADSVVLACILLCTPLRRRWSLVAMLFLVFGTGMIACGGGSSSSPGGPPTTAGKYTFTLAGTDSADANTNTQTQFTITVQ